MLRAPGFVGAMLFLVTLTFPSSPVLSDTKSLVPKVAAMLNSSPKRARIVCFGDSVTGVYYHTGGRRAYTAMLKIALERAVAGASVSAINAGISGHTTRNALSRIDRDVLQYSPDLVTVMFGLNDLTRVPLEEYRANLTKIIRRCRESGAEVLLCTPNSVTSTKSRPVAKLERYVAAMREVGTETQVPVVDCYRAYEDVRSKDPREWSLLMSDAIHPNMDGHRLIAEEIALAILGKRVSLASVEPPDQTLLKTFTRLKSEKPIKILAMPPFDKLLPAALLAVSPGAQLDVTRWPTEGQSLAEIEQAARQVRAQKPDLVVIAVPTSAGTDSTEQYIRSYTWILNRSLSFGKQEWDCIAIRPSHWQSELTEEQMARDRLVGRLIRAQDLGTIGPEPPNGLPIQTIIERWVKSEWHAATSRNERIER